MNYGFKLCKHYTLHMDTLHEYCKCLYKLPDCASGGPLHILLDDNNIDTDDILFCLNECITNPDNEGSKLGALICEEYLKMSMTERRIFDWYWNGWDLVCTSGGNCSDCKYIKEDNYD